MDKVIEDCIQAHYQGFIRVIAKLEASGEDYDLDVAQEYVESLVARIAREEEASDVPLLRIEEVVRQCVDAIVCKEN